jgi:hypothetical protein
MCYTKFVKPIGDLASLLSVILILSLSPLAMGQNTDNPDPFAQAFSAKSNDASLGCALLLPSNVPGITNLMTICGGRFAFRVAPEGMLEAQLLGGAGQAQKYYMGSFSYRADIALDDMMASLYGGADIIDAVSPIQDAFGNNIDSTSTFYLGVHVGVALWWELSTSFYLRSDLQLNYSPGTTLLVFLSGVYRWSGNGN